METLSQKEIQNVKTVSFTTKSVDTIVILAATYASFAIFKTGLEMILMQVSTDVSCSF